MRQISKSLTTQENIYTNKNIDSMKQAINRRQTRRLLTLLAACHFALITAIAQVGSWRAYMSYYEPQDIVKAGDMLFVRASNGLYSYNLNDHSISTYDKVRQLNDSYVTHIAWNTKVGRLLTVYQNSNLDIIDAGGNIKIVNNSDIRSVVNQTQELSIAKCYMPIDYGMPIEKVEAVIADNLAKVKAAIPAIEEGPYYKGVAELADSSVNLLFIAKCKEDAIYQVQRDLNRELLIVFNNNNIDIPFNQIVVDYREDKKQTATKKEVKKAEALNAEQKELSADLEVKPVND